jgi:hypothetical protein
VPSIARQPIETFSGAPYVVIDQKKRTGTTCRIGCAYEWSLGVDVAAAGADAGSA